MCKISIIIPIYNTGIFLKKCVQSVIGQTLSDIEIILVDDGSTDESSRICDELASKDRRIKVIHKKNEGVSIARNAGIDIAQGEYIGFIDSDDWIERDMYHDLYHKAKETNAEIVMCDAITKYADREDEADTITQLKSSGIIKRQDISPNLLIEIAGSAWRCIYKRTFIEGNNIRFPENLKISEDRIFNILAFGYCKYFYYIKNGYYNRFVRIGSAVNSYHKDSIYIAIDARRRTMNALDAAWNGDEAYKTIYENHIVTAAYSAVNNAFHKDSPLTLKEKYIAVKDICGKEEVRNGIIKLKRNDLRSRLILRKQVLSLCLIAILLNQKHRR